jgi:hypothetical protein
MPDSEPSHTGPMARPKQALYAAGAMVALAALTLVVVLAWFATASDPWTWRGLVAMATVPFALGTAWLVWRLPTRENAGAALLVVAFSLVRIGLPDEWTRATYVLIALTLAAGAPVAWAARTLPS